MRECNQCHKKKPKSAFYTSKVEGTEYIRGECKICHKKNDKQRRKNIKKWFRNYRQKFKCERCGFEDHRALQFHHTDNNKVEDVATMVAHGYSRSKIKKEIEKCEVLCANCHQIEHY